MPITTHLQHPAGRNPVKMHRAANTLLTLALGGSLLWVTTPVALAAGLPPHQIAPSAPVRQEEPQPIYALQGTLGRAVNQNFATFLVTADGTAYALVGQTPDIEQQLTTLRDQGEDTVVKVWGALYPQGRVSATPEIVVANVLAVASSPQPAQPSVPTATVRNATINIRTGPGTNYEQVGTLDQGTSCTIVGREPANTWWQVQCPGGRNGWIYQPLVDTTGNTGAVPVSPVPAPPPPPAAPQPTTFYGWKAEYFPNRNLSGSPTLVQDSPNVDFNWGGGAPPGLPADNFSARYERTINFNPGSYRFRARSDDGIRVFVDGQPLIDQWNIHSGNFEFTADRSMYGNQTVRVEYFEGDGLAEVHLAFDPLSTSQPIDGGGSGEWQAAYYNNPNLSGNPALTRREPRASYPLDQNWGGGSPASGIINDDNWSARWTGTFYFDAGDYQFQTNTDDGVRLYIDGLRVIDAWGDGYKEPSNQFRRLGAGNHQITIEYYERGGGALNRVWWWRTGGSGGSSGGGFNRD
jgi:uncharacterized protein YraI